MGALRPARGHCCNQTLAHGGIPASALAFKRRACNPIVRTPPLHKVCTNRAKAVLLWHLHDRRATNCHSADEAWHAPRKCMLMHTEYVQLVCTDRSQCTKDIPGPHEGGAAQAWMTDNVSVSLACREERDEHCAPDGNSSVE